MARLPQFLLGILFIFFMAGACSKQDFTGFSETKKGPKSSADAIKADPVDGVDTEEPPAFVIEPPTVFVEPPPENTEELKLTVPPKELESERVSKVLIVIDNSVSMNPFLAKVNEGFVALAAEGVSAGSKIGVINSMVAVEPTGTENLTPAGGLKSYTGYEVEPGFQALVNDAAIQLFKGSTTPNIASRFPLNGCGDWFSPSETNAQGEACITAHVQIAATAIGCEPLLHAYSQFANRYQNVFSDYEELDVIFVSDEKGPGCGNTLYTQTIPTLDEIRKATLTNNPNLKKVLFHGILNTDGELGQMAKVVNENKGVLFDIGSESEAYKRLINQIVTKASPTNEYKLSLTHAPTEILSITVDGQPYTGGQELVGNELNLLELPTQVEISVIVAYKY